ncbi:hypothetical protein CLOM_g17644, partial [Closterium sp. NIES-68]
MPPRTAVPFSLTTTAFLLLRPNLRCCHVSGRGVRGKETVEEEEEEEEEEEGGDAEEEGLDLEEAVFEGGGGKGDSALGYNA